MKTLLTLPPSELKKTDTRKIKSNDPLFPYTSGKQYPQVQIMQDYWIIQDNCTRMDRMQLGDLV